MNLDDMRAGANNQLSETKNVTESQKTSSLKDVMAEMINKSTESESVENNTYNGTPIPPGMEEIVNSDWFKSLPNEGKQAVLSGKNLDPSMAELDDAVVQSKNDVLAEINELRAAEGKEELKPSDIDDLKAAKFVDNDTNTGSANFFTGDDEFSQLLKNSEPEDNEDEVLTREMKSFEEYVAEAVDVFPTTQSDWDDKSAALTVKILRSKQYEDTIKSILDINDIKFKTSKKGNLKQAVLRTFVQRNNHVTVPLINSGIYVTLSGASIPEIMQMNNMRYNSRVEFEFKKMQFIWKHLVDTSIGKIPTIQEFMKIVHFRDVDTLYYTLYVGTFPDVNDYPTSCQNQQCQQSLALKLHASDLVLNADEFSDISNYIMYENMDIKNLLEKSYLSKEKQVILPNKIVVNFKNLSVFDYISSMSRIEKFFASKKKNTDDYSLFIGMMYFIDYLALPTGDNETYVKYTDPDDICEILMAIDEDSNDIITDEIENFMGKNLIKYGLKAHICPKCGHVHKEREIDMSQFLFTLVNMKMVVKQIQKQRKKEELKDKN